MKLVTAFIRKEKLIDVISALFEKNIHGLTVSNVKGHGGEGEKVETYRGTRVKKELSEKLKLEIGVSDEFVDLAVKTVMSSARTGNVGDGKIFVIPVEKVYRIRTGEEDNQAVTPLTPKN